MQCTCVDVLQITSAAIEVGGKVRNRFGGMGRFNGWVKGRVNGVITHTAGV